VICAVWESSASRMPSSRNLLGLIDEIQQRARRPIRAGATGGEIYAGALQLVEASAHRSYLEFVAHGMGLVSHEAPRLTSSGPVPYGAHDKARPLEADMVISIETTMAHPKRGFIKLGDTVAVTASGCMIAPATEGALGRE
jgi:Xaa-Pro aminopeptidase